MSPLPRTGDGMQHFVRVQRSRKGAATPPKPDTKREGPRSQPLAPRALQHPKKQAPSEASRRQLRGTPRATPSKKADTKRSGGDKRTCVSGRSSPVLAFRSSPIQHFDRCMCDQTRL